MASEGRSQVAEIKSYRDLLVWQKAMDLVTEVYRVTKEFPKEERFGLTEQIRRAAVSLPANIAEGQGRRHRREFRNFLSIALGSLAELETHLEIARRLGYLTLEAYEALLCQTQELGRMVNGLLRSLPPN